MFNKKKHRIEELEKENTRLNLQIELFEAGTRSLKNRLEVFERGERCDGKWCDHCVHYEGSEYEWVNGSLQATRAVCLKDVPCPDFKRRGSPRPNKQEGGHSPR